MSFKTNILIDTIQNENFRKVLFTGKKSQLVIMNIPAHSEIGEEVHEFVEQTLFFLSGECNAILNDEQYICTAGDVVVVTPGIKHNFINTGDEAVKIYTVYSPANHIDGRIHSTREDAEADVEDEAVGHSYKQ
jgi:mannose-6-phosphate isomerase-like protein (cupin superfamily)